MSACSVLSPSSSTETIDTTLPSPATAPTSSAEREQMIERHVALAVRLARRFRNRGEPMDDLRQVAVLGLIKAVDGFDPERGDDFVRYAVPTILGELRRHFRDRGWDVRVPRRCQELSAEIGSASERLTQTLFRTPTPADLAEELGTTVSEIRETMVAGQAYSSVSLHRPLHDDEPATVIADLLADEEEGYERVETCQTLRQVLPHLPERERHILGLRFYHQMTQSEIAREVGVSQMHVSRLLTRSLEQLRERMLDLAA